MLKLFTFIIISLIAFGSCKSEEKPVINPIPVKVSKVELYDVNDLNMLSGQVIASKTAYLSFKVSGKISEVFVKEGDFVKEGQVLAKLDTADYNLQYKIAKENYDISQKEFVRRDPLLSKGAISKSEYEQYESKKDISKHQYELAAKNIEYSVLKAPFTGMIGKKNLEIGELTSPERVIFVLADISKVKITAGIPDVKLNSYKVGDTMETLIEAVGDKKYKGVITNIGVIPDPATRTYSLEVEMDNPNNLIKPLMIAKLVKKDEQSTMSICVPLDIIRKNILGEPIVYVYDESTSQVREKRISLGAPWKNKVVVLAGLEQNDIVVTSGQHYVRNNSIVKIIKDHME